MDIADRQGEVLWWRKGQAVIARSCCRAQRMHASGESAGTIAAALGVSRATVYRTLAQ